MKKNFLVLCLTALLVFVINTSKAQYIDLSTGKTITVVKHQGNGMMYNPENQRAVYLYVDAATKDTIYGRTGAVINGKVRRMSDGKFAYYGDEGFVYDEGEFRTRRESDGYRKVFQGDGDVKLKGDNYKKKTELDGDVKTKDNGSKVKTKENGELKVKDGDFRAKIDEDANEKIKDSNTKVKMNSDGTMKLKDKEEDYKKKLTDSGKMKEKKGDRKRKVKNNTEKIKNRQNTSIVTANS